jgi:hypothetical protein
MAIDPEEQCFRTKKGERHPTGTMCLALAEELDPFRITSAARYMIFGVDRFGGMLEL